MIREFAALRSEIEALKNVIGRMIVSGPIEIADAQKGYRIKLGDNPDGSPVLSPWYRHPESGKTSVPLKKGQVVTSINPGGDPRQGSIIPGGYSQGHPSPNDDLEANVFDDGGLVVTVKAGGLTISATGQVEISAGGGHLK